MMSPISKAEANIEFKSDINEHNERTARVFKYTRSRELKFFVKLYDYSINKDGSDMYFTMCGVLGSGEDIYSDTTAEKFLTDIIEDCECVGYITPKCKKSIIHNSKPPKAFYYENIKILKIYTAAE